MGLPIETADLFPADLSGGMQKRVGFARRCNCAGYFAARQSDSRARPHSCGTHRCHDFISGTKNGATVISATGNMVNLTQAYDDIAVLHDGTLRWHGDADCAEKDDNPWLRQLLSAVVQARSKRLILKRNRRVQDVWIEQKNRNADTRDTLPGREMTMPVPPQHFVLGTDMLAPWPENTELAMFGMGCFGGRAQVLAGGRCVFDPSRLCRRSDAKPDL